MSGESGHGIHGGHRTGSPLVRTRPSRGLGRPGRVGIPRIFLGRVGPGEEISGRVGLGSLGRVGWGISGQGRRRGELFGTGSPRELRPSRQGRTRAWTGLDVVAQGRRAGEPASAPLSNGKPMGGDWISRAPGRRRGRLRGGNESDPGTASFARRRGGVGWHLAFENLADPALFLHPSKVPRHFGIRRSAVRATVTDPVYSIRLHFASARSTRPCPRARREDFLFFL